MKVDFDEHSLTYRQEINESIGFFKKDDSFFDYMKLYYFTNYVIKKQSSEILDFGCGIGKLSSLLSEKFNLSTIYGYDISQKSLDLARKNTCNRKNIFFIDKLYDGRLYDFIIVSNVFHHIQPRERMKILLELKTLLKPDGQIVVFEHNPMNPVTRYVVSRCAFDVDAHLIWRCNFIKTAKSCNLKVVNKMYILFFPWLLEIFRFLERFLHKLPLGAQYMLILGK